ncbi:hypothetical protein PC119_g13685 [Phytophthora cactorum]|uniref:Uncharacterized protein n=1 Tax=Phytophthora cactorum TaxID=29920 RepID=A0A8T1CZ72_9STRA|nr:hypothetical protein PC114_g14206 [Phytophthora cactorum]KAG2930014.1 hypothetical protein PC117_g13824 [Phytophthora cactorum]KAG3010038.1 hypothetical protein PC119_g13685 [Phytophthora cactorum]
MSELVANSRAPSCRTNLTFLPNCVCTFMMYVLMQSSLSDLARRQKPFIHPLASSTISSRYLLPPSEFSSMGPQMSKWSNSNVS